MLHLLNANNRLLGIPALPAMLAPPPLPAFKPMPMPKAPTATAGAVGKTHGAKFDGSGPVAVIAKNAARFGLDPAAVLAYALEESGGSWKAVGDNNSSFGPLQMHRGGALGAHSPQWAMSPAGLIAGMQMMANTPARGLTGAAAVRAIYQYFGKGTPRAVPKGLARYGDAQQILAGNMAAPTAPKMEGHIAQPGSAAALGHNPDVVVDHQSKIAPLAVTILKLAAQYLGTPYHWGGASPATGFDCSGFVQWLYAQKGIRLPRTTFEQVHAGRPITGALKPGDILFFEPTPKGPGHEGLYIGNGQFIQAPHTGDVVKISRLKDYLGVYVTARRIL